MKLELETLNHSLKKLWLRQDNSSKILRKNIKN